VIALPDVGFHGNSHMLMQDKNSLQVAGWLLAPAPDEIAAVAEEVEDDEQAEDQDAL